MCCGLLGMTSSFVLRSRVWIGTRLLSLALMLFLCTWFSKHHVYLALLYFVARLVVDSGLHELYNCFVVYFRRPPRRYGPSPRAAPHSQVAQLALADMHRSSSLVAAALARLAKCVLCVFCPISSAWHARGGSWHWVPIGFDLFWLVLLPFVGTKAVLPMQLLFLAWVLGLILYLCLPPVGVTALCNLLQEGPLEHRRAVGVLGVFERRDGVYRRKSWVSCTVLSSAGLCVTNWHVRVSAARDEELFYLVGLLEDVEDPRSSTWQFEVLETDLHPFHKLRDLAHFFISRRVVAHLQVSVLQDTFSCPGLLSIENRPFHLTSLKVAPTEPLNSTELTSMGFCGKDGDADGNGRLLLAPTLQCLQCSWISEKVPLSPDLWATHAGRGQRVHGSWDQGASGGPIVDKISHRVVGLCTWIMRGGGVSVELEDIRAITQDNEYE